MAAAAPAAGFAPAPRVNLMPRAETDRRARSSLARRWSLAIVGALGLVIVVSALAFTMQIAASARLATESARTTTLLGELAALSDVRDALALENELTTFRAQAMATDVAWVPLIDRIQPALPAGSSVIGFNLTPGGVPQGDDLAAEIGVNGTLTVTSATAEDVLSTVRAIRPMSGVIEVDGWTSELIDGAYTSEIRLVMDQTLYTGEYAEEAAE